MKISVLAILTGILLTAPTIATANVVESGFVTVTNLGNSGSYSILGNGFAATGGLQVGGWMLFISCSPCPSGTSANINGTVSGGDVDGGHLLRFTGPNVLLTPGLVFADFSFEGLFCQGGYSLYCPGGLLPLTGSGQVQIEVLTNPSPPNTVYVKSFTYIFSTPEPSFAPMIALGLTALAGAKWFSGTKRFRLCKTEIT